MYNDEEYEKRIQIKRKVRKMKTLIGTSALEVHNSSKISASSNPSCVRIIA